MGLNGMHGCRAVLFVAGFGVALTICDWGVSSVFICNELVDEPQKHFDSQSLEFLFGQEVYARKQGPNELFALYMEDIIRKSQRLSLSDKDMMNSFVNGLNESIKTHVILNQPKTFAEAKHLAHLHDSVSKTSASSFPQMPSSTPPPEQCIKELEGQVNLLFSIANKNACPHLKSCFYLQ